MNSYVLSILVKNHSGVLRRVSGLFSRRGYNIKSLSVGETEDSRISRITVVVSGDEYIVEQITRQVSKLIEVINIEKINSGEVFRELALIRIKTTTEMRSEIIEMINIFRARVVDVSESSLIAEVTGDNSKVEAFIKAVEPYGILELVRTGLTAIKRGNSIASEEKQSF